MPFPDGPLGDAQRRFQQLVEQQLGPLLKFSQRRTATLSDAEDAVQETCLRAWMAFAELRDESKVRAWLFQILRGVLSDWMIRDSRRLRLAGMISLEDAPEQALASESDAVFIEVAARLSSEAVRAALALLPPDFATAVELHDIDGLRYNEIAEALEIPIGTVMSRISRGRRLLARAISVTRAARPLVAHQPVALEGG